MGLSVRSGAAYESRCHVCNRELKAALLFDPEALDSPITVEVRCRCGEVVALAVKASVTLEAKVSGYRANETVRAMLETKLAFEAIDVMGQSERRPRKGEIWRRRRDGVLCRVLYRRRGWVFAYDGECGEGHGRGMTEAAFRDNHDFERRAA